MLSDDDQDFLDDFSEVSVIGQGLADKFNEWNEGNFEETKADDNILSDMSGDTVILYYKDKGFEDEEIFKLLKSVGYSPIEDSDDAVPSEIDKKKPPEVGERLNAFLEQCIDISESFAGLVKNVELQEGNSQSQEEVRIVIPSNIDIRKMPSNSEPKIEFMKYLQKIRSIAAQYYMTDEMIFFSSRAKEMWLIFRTFGKQKK